MRLIRKNNSFSITDLKLEKKYDYAKYTRDNDLGSRHYNVGDIKIPSVTTILSATQSEDKKAGLDRWRERVGYQEAQRITTQAATAATVNETSYKRPKVTDGLFNYTVSLNKGGMLRQGKPKLAKKGWK